MSRRSNVTFYKYFIIFTVFLFGPSFCSDYNEISLNKSASLFAAKLYKELFVRNPNDNILISPVSIQLILGLVKLGARDLTAQELSQVLILPNDNKILKEHLYALHETFKRSREVNSKEANVTIANAIYVRPDVRVSDQFYQDAKKYLHIDVRSLENKFNNASIVSQINEWVAQETNEQIKQVLQDSDVTPDTVMLLLNTLHFKGMWRDNGFNISETKTERFYTDDVQYVWVPMMRATDYFLIGRYNTLNITYLELPYSGKNIDETGDYVFGIYLPDTYKNGLTTITDNLSHLLSQAPEISNMEQVDVRLPRFKLNSKNRLKPVLEYLGLKHVFNNAQLNGLTIDKKSIQITDVIHNTALDVSEKGTEASAVTVVGIDDRIFSQPILFLVNRPFFFVLKQKSTNIILFIGHYKV